MFVPVTPGLEEEVEVMSSSLHTTLNSLNKAHNRLSSTQIELQYTVQRLQVYCAVYTTVLQVYWYTVHY